MGSSTGGDITGDARKKCIEAYSFEYRITNTEGWIEAVSPAHVFWNTSSSSTNIALRSSIFVGSKKSDFSLDNNDLARIGALLSSGAISVLLKSPRDRIGTFSLYYHDTLILTITRFSENE